MSGSVKAGTLTAVMGPSGSGKTTLLAAISKRIRGDIEGQVYLDDYPASPNHLKSCSVYVPQADFLLDTLTPLEHLRFLAKLKFGAFIINEVEAKIFEIFIQLELFSVANTRIGKLSGGQRRKLMLAGELLDDPRILICDEPTSSLDSFSALSVVKSLRQLAGCHDLPRIVLCSIHQPSSELFHIFTHLILVQNKNIVFQGTLEEATIAFTQAGLACPDLYNPAEHYVRMTAYHQITLNQISKPQASNEDVETFERKPNSFIRETQRIASEETITDRQHTTWFNQTFCLMQRSIRISFRSYTQHLIESSFYLVL